MPFKFEKLEVWRLALEYVDLVYALADQLPRSEDVNLKSQLKRAATSVALNIAEGSTGQTDHEQARFQHDPPVGVPAQLQEPHRAPVHLVAAPAAEEVDSRRDRDHHEAIQQQRVLEDHC